MNNSDFAIRRLQCRHIFTDGHRCGSPCLRGEDFCFYHHNTRRPKPSATSHDPYNEPPNQTAFTLPIPEDRSAIQHSIGEIMNQLARNALDPRRAGLLLYALQIASLNLNANTRRQPTATPTDTVEEITVDPILGPLAPEAEMGENETEDPLQTLLTQLEHFNIEPEQLSTAPSTVPEAADALTLQACAAPNLPRPTFRYPAKSFFRRTLTRKYPGEEWCPAEKLAPSSLRRHLFR